MINFVFDTINVYALRSNLINCSFVHIFTTKAAFLSPCIIGISSSQLKTRKLIFSAEKSLHNEFRNFVVEWLPFKCLLLNNLDAPQRRT